LATFKNTNEAEIVNKYWKLVELDGQKVSMKENQEREQYFMLKSDGTVSGFAGCNYFNGTYTLKEGMRLKFEENMALTMKACPDIEENETEF
jgi:heat shock protein HslJ